MRVQSQKWLRSAWKLMRHGRRVLSGHDVPTVFCPSRNVLRFGTAYGGWTFAPNGLQSTSVVYSAGIGKDVSFDTELIHAFDHEVHAFDPTPAVWGWLSTQKLPERFIPHPWGLAASDGDLPFFVPKNRSARVCTGQNEPGDRRQFLSVKRLSTIMNELGHDHLDLLKMDVEGSEYGVIQDIVENRIPVRQILVEFHHRLPGYGRSATSAAVKTLRQAGFRLIAVSDQYTEYTFLNVGNGWGSANG